MIIKPEPFARRKRLPGEALPGTYDLRVENYNPAKHNPPLPARPGSLDFLSKPSRGYRT